MISLTEIEQFYPENQRPFKRNLLREYLQRKILQIIFDTEFTPKLCLMEGTCLRIVLGTNRISEDLDFDNFGLAAAEFDRLSAVVADELNADGYAVNLSRKGKNSKKPRIRACGPCFRFLGQQ